MSHTKCPQCGLINFATDEVCQRCREPLSRTEATAHAQELVILRSSHTANKRRTIFGHSQNKRTTNSLPPSAIAKAGKEHPQIRERVKA